MSINFPSRKDNYFDLLRKIVQNTATSMSSQLPVSNDNDYVLLKKIAHNTAEIADTIKPFPEVELYSMLPAASDNNGKIYVVLQSSGVIFINRKPRGFYRSNGSVWELIDELPDEYFDDYATEEFVKTPVVQTVTSAGSVIPAQTDDAVNVTALAQDMTLENPSGTLVNMQRFIVRILDDGVSRNLFFGSKYRGVGAAIPTSTTPSKRMYLGFMYNADDDKLDLIAVTQES